MRIPIFSGKGVFGAVVPRWWGGGGVYPLPKIGGSGDGERAYVPPGSMGVDGGGGCYTSHLNRVSFCDTLYMRTIMLQIVKNITNWH